MSANRNKRSGARRVAAALVVMMLALVAGSAAWAQDGAKPGAAPAGGAPVDPSKIPDKPKSLQKDEKKGGEEAVSKGPSGNLSDATDKRDPEEVKKLQEKIRSLNQSQIDKIDRILEKDPTHARKADMLFQKAELTYEVLTYDNLLKRAEWLKCLEASEQGSVDASKCAEPAADYTLALDVYKQVLQEFPDYSRLDEVIYRLGDGLMKAEKKKEGVSFLTRLVKNYPNSKYLPDAHLAIAEFWFDQNLLTPAKLSYEEVLKFKDTPLYNYALYKLAWVLYNQKEFREAVNTFKRVIEETEKDPNQAKLGFANQALNDLVVSWVELDDGWKEAKDYFIKKKDKDFAHKKLRQMAGLYDSTGKNEERVAIFEYLLNDNPVDPKAPDYWESIIDARKKMNVRENWEKSVREMIGYFDPKGKWWGANAADSKTTGNARLLAEGYLAQLATEYHQRAQQSNDKKLYEQAAKDYAFFLDKFSDSEDAYNIRFYYAEILFDELTRYEDSAEQYKQVIASKPDGEHAKNARFALIKSYEKLVLRDHKDSVLTLLSSDDKKTNVRLEAVDPKKGEDLKEATKKERSDLFKWEAPFVEASDLWATAYPTDENTPTINYVSAEIYRSHGQYDNAVSRYEAIIQNAPKHLYASYAGNSLLECHNELKNWGDLEKWGRYLLDNKIFDVTPKDKLQNAIAYAINERAKQLSAEGKFEEGAGELLRLANEWPDMDVAPGAIFNAAAIYERQENLKKATENYELLIKKYPKHKLAPEAVFVMGAIFEARTDFDTAADYFARLSDNKDWRDTYEKTQDALYNSAYIRESLEQWDDSIKTYEKYLKQYPTAEAAPQLAFHLGELYERAGNKKQALKVYQDFLKKYPKETRLGVESNLNIGKLTLEAGGKNAEKDADTYFIRAFDGWSKATDEKVKGETREAAAEALFLRAELIHRKYKAAPLQNMNNLVKELTTKGELLSQAETLYFQVIDMRSPLWTAAGAYRIGEMYKDFSDGLYNYPVPEGLPPELEDEYRGQIDEFSFPLQEKALKGFQKALSLSLELGAYNEWSEKSAAEMSKLEAALYPLTGQEGVATTHRSQVFLNSGSLTLEDVNKRAQEKLKATEGTQPQPNP